MILTSFTLPLLIFSITQAALIPFELIHYLARKSESSRLRFFTLSILSLLLNLTIVLSVNISGEEEQYFGYIPRLVSVATIAYTFYYICVEQQLKTSKREMLKLIALLVITYSLETYLIINAFNDWIVSTVNTLLFEVIVILFSLKILRYNKPSKPRLSGLGIASICVVFITFIIPLVLNFGETQFIRATVLNIPFFILATVYIYEHIKHAQIEEDLISNHTFVVSQSLHERYQIQELLHDNRKLSVREKEIVVLLLKKLSYTEIGDQLNISPATVRSHAKTIRMKLGVKNQDEFYKKYLNT